MALVLLAEFSTMTDLHRGREGQALQAVQHGDTAWGVSKGGLLDNHCPPIFYSHMPPPLLMDVCTQAAKS